jgi:hypothetical protein
MNGEASGSQKLVRALKENARQLGSRVLERWISDGYEDAAHVCTGVLERHIDELHAKNRSGKKLTQHEQLLLTNLSDIKTEMERETQHAWENNVRP